LLLAGCGRRERESAVDAGVVTLGPEDVAVVARRVIQSGPRIAGTLAPAQRAEVRAKLGGTVAEVRAERGQPVVPGQVLALIEAAPAREAYRSARAAVRAADDAAAVAAHQEQRTARLVEAGGLAQRDLDVARNATTSARAQAAEARARLASAADQLEAATVRAPLRGVISARAVSAGDVVAVGGALFTVVDPSSMRLEATVPAAAIAQLRVGTTVGFQVHGYPGRTFDGRIEHIAPEADPGTRQLPILVSLPNPGGLLVGGLFAEGRVATRQRETLVAPMAAVDLAAEPPAVLRVRQGVVERVSVRVGLRDELREEVELASGVAAGDRLLLGAARALAPGTRVQLAPGEGAHAAR
jgi:RND family efflux transporter MFP subunit